MESAISSQSWLHRIGGLNRSEWCKRSYRAGVRACRSFVKLPCCQAGHETSRFPFGLSVYIGDDCRVSAERLGFNSQGLRRDFPGAIPRV